MLEAYDRAVLRRDPAEPLRIEEDCEPMVETIGKATMRPVGYCYGCRHLSASRWCSVAHERRRLRSLACSMWERVEIELDPPRDAIEALTDACGVPMRRESK